MLKALLCALLRSLKGDAFGAAGNMARGAHRRIVPFVAAVGGGAYFITFLSELYIPSVQCVARDCRAVLGVHILKPGVFGKTTVEAHPENPHNC
jgi:hypothetical protein